jgi:superoxide dismutase
VGATLTPAIDPAFGSAGELEAASTNAAVELFGSGWVWLVRKPGSLEVVATRNADTPLRTVARVGKGDRSLEHLPRPGKVLLDDRELSGQYEVPPGPLLAKATVVEELLESLAGQPELPT